MASNPDSGGPSRASEQLRLLTHRVDELGRQIEDLARIVRGRPEGAGGTDRPASWETSSDGAPRARDLFPSRRLDLLARLLNDQERRTTSLAQRVDDHDRLLRMLSLALRELDDPYGLGVGLDERIGLEDRDDEGEVS